MCQFFEGWIICPNPPAIQINQLKNIEFKRRAVLMSVLCERERVGKDKRGKHQWWDVKHLLKCHRKARTCSVTQCMGVPGRMCVCVCVIGCYSTVHTKHSLPASDGCDPAGVAMVLKQASPVSHSRPSITQPPVVRLSVPGSSYPDSAGLSRISLIPSASRRAPAAGLTGPLPAGG